MSVMVEAKARRGGFSLDVNFTADSHITGLFGPSGAGKTTLIHAMAGLIAPETGRITVGDETVFDSAAGLNVPPHKRRVGLVFQDTRLFPHYAVKENLRFGLRFHRAGEVKFTDVVELLELDQLLDRTPRSLSGGERQRVAIGRALLASPRLLLFDEPLSSLDRPRKNQILPYLRRVRDAINVPMLYVSHDLSELLDLTSDLVLLDGGTVAGKGHYLDLVQQAAPLHLMRASGLANVLELTVTEHDRAEGLTLLRTESGATGPAIKGSVMTASAGAKVHAIIRPEDIAFSLERLDRTSIQNHVRGHITRIITTPEKTLCVVDAGVPLLVEVSHHAVHELHLAEGAAVWCMFKANALRYVL